MIDTPQVAALEWSIALFIMVMIVCALYLAMREGQSGQAKRYDVLAEASRIARARWYKKDEVAE